MSPKKMVPRKSAGRTGAEDALSPELQRRRGRMPFRLRAGFYGGWVTPYTYNVAPDLLNSSQWGGGGTSGGTMGEGGMGEGGMGGGGDAGGGGGDGGGGAGL